MALVTGRIDSSEILAENEALREKSFKLSDELLRLKNLFKDKLSPIEFSNSRSIFTESLKIQPEKLEKKEFLESQTPHFQEKPKIPRFTDTFNKKEAESILELFEAGDFEAAAEKWKRINFAFLETTTDKNNFEMLKKVFLIKNFQKLEEENFCLREKLADKANKLTFLYENQNPSGNIDQNKENIDELKKMVYECSAHSIYLENQLKLIKSRVPNLLDIQKSLNSANSLKNITDYIQGKVLDQFEKLNSEVIENLRFSLMQKIKEKTNFEYELICVKLQNSRLEKLLEEEKKWKKVFKSTNLSKILENWKAYKKDYIIRVENVYKNEINELNETIRKISSEISVSSTDIEEKYIREIQELTCKLKKEHEDKLKLAEFLNKIKANTSTAELEKKYSDCKMALQESNGKIFCLEQEIMKLIENSDENATKINEILIENEGLQGEKTKLYNEITLLHRKLKENFVEKEKLAKENRKFEEILGQQTEKLKEQFETNENMNKFVKNLQKEIFDTDSKLKKREHELNFDEHEKILQKYTKCKENKKKYAENLQKLDEEYKKTIEEKQEILEDFNKTVEEKNKIQDRVNEIFVEKEKLQKEITSFYKKEESFIENIKILKKDLEKLESVNKNLEKDRESVVSQHKSVDIKLQNTFEDYKELEKNNEKLSGLLKNCQEDLETLKTQLNQSKAKIFDIESEKSNLQNDLQALKTQKNTLISEKKDLTQSLSLANTLVKETQAELLQKSFELSELQTTIESSQKFLEDYQNKYENSSKDYQNLAFSIKTMHESLCKDLKMDLPLFSQNSKELIETAYSHLVNYCKENSKNFMAHELSGITDQNIKIKYLQLISENSLLKIFNSRSLLENLKNLKETHNLTNLPDWVLERWQQTLEDSDKLRQELVFLASELETRIKENSSLYVEKTLGEANNYKLEIEKITEERLQNSQRQENLMSEIEFLKQENFEIFKDFQKKLSSAEENFYEWKSCFLDVFAKIPKKMVKNDSPLAMRNEIISFLNSFDHSNENIEHLLYQNSELLRINEEYGKKISKMTEQNEALERNFIKQNELVSECSHLKIKITNLIAENEFLEKKLRETRFESGCKNCFEEKNVREALEAELTNKCDLVFQLVEEIEKYKKFLKIREYEYQELLTLKDEEILRLRLKAS